MTAARLRLMYSSNSIWSTSGYGIQGKSLLPRLAELPEFDGGRDDPMYGRSGRANLANFAWYGLSSGLHHHEGFRIYPAGNDPYGNDVIGQHTRHFGANIVVTLIDAWVLRDIAKKIAPALFLPWLPIDHDPVPQRVLDSIADAHLPLTYAKWGHKMLTDAGVPNHYIPHGVETGIYRVLQERDKVAHFKAKFTGREDAHLTVMVAANKGFPDRKAFQVQVRAWKEFAKDKPEAKLYIHTEPTPMYGGIDFAALLRDLGIQDRVTFPDQYENFIGLPQQYLSLVYNAADVLLGASMSEGFGIPLIEAQACGCPVVTTNFSAMPELVRWGKAVDPLDMVWTPMNAWQAWPNARGITDELNRLYDAWLAAGGNWTVEQRQACSAQIHDEYSWDTIVRDQWAPLMTRLADEAPPLDARFRMAVPTLPQPPANDAQEFVNVLNDEMAKAKPKRRVAPLVKAQVISE